MNQIDETEQMIRSKIGDEAGDKFARDHRIMKLIATFGGILMVISLLNFIREGGLNDLSIILVFSAGAFVACSFLYARMSAKAIKAMR
jgi:uncharacterized membrane protein